MTKFLPPLTFFVQIFGFVCLFLMKPSIADAIEIRGAKCEQFLTDHMFMQKTELVANMISPNLLTAIRSFESMGGEGGWFKSVSPYSADTKTSYFYLVKKVPAKADASSNIWLVRLEHSRDFIAALVQSGRLIVIGDVGTDQAEAMTLGSDYKLGADGIAISGSPHDGIILIKPDADEFVLAHENQHLADYAPGFTAAMQNGLKDYLSADYLSDVEKQWLYRFILEIRGHSTQEIQVKTNAANALPILDRLGSIRTSPEDRQSLYGLQAGMAVSTFMDTYPPILWPIAAKIKQHNPTEYGKFVEAISKFDFSSNPLASLSFRKLIGN
jgi:hypothetical protein